MFAIIVTTIRTTLLCFLCYVPILCADRDGLSYSFCLSSCRWNCFKESFWEQIQSKHCLCPQRNGIIPSTFDFNPPRCSACFAFLYLRHQFPRVVVTFEYFDWWTILICHMCLFVFPNLEDFFNDYLVTTHFGSFNVVNPRFFPHFKA